MAPDDDQEMALPCASVIVIMVLLKLACTWATPDVMFFFSRRRTRALSLAMLYSRIYELLPRERMARPRLSATYFFLPAIGLAGPFRVRALVWVRWPRTGNPRR